MKNLPTTEERVWAVLAHLSALALGMGIVLPMIGWSEQRRKSKYASFQCLQALGYQSLGYTVWLLIFLLLMVGLVILIIIVDAIGAKTGNYADKFETQWFILFIVISFGVSGIYILFSIIAAAACALGKDFRYPVMGNRLAKYLGYDDIQTIDQQIELIEDHEDRWVAAMGHFSVIIALWGMLAPLTAWIMQGKRSVFLKFQSVQTLVYQVFVTLLSLGTWVIYMFGFVAFMGTIGLNPSNIDSTEGVVGLIIFGLSLLISFGIMFIIPLFHIMGQWAGYRVLKGDNYRYPIVGKLVERWQRSSGAQPLTEQKNIEENVL